MGLLGWIVGAGLVCAQTPSLISPQWEMAPVVTEPAKPTPAMERAAADVLEQRIAAPEIWRLPPVVPPVSPAALAIPPIEMIPGPSSESCGDKAPMANAPMSLSGTFEESDFLVKKPDPCKLWDGSFDLGWDGSEGNSETFNFRFGCHVARKQESNILTLGVDYNKSTAQTKPTANHLFFEGRFEWLIHQTRWSWFLHETIEYDEFQSYDVRDTSDAGLGYRLVQNETMTLIGRFGAGFVHEYGGPDNGVYTPEAVFGLQLERQISRRQKLLGLVEYAPGFGDFLNYRIRSQAAWELLLDTERNLSLRIGVLNRYTSQPNGARPNDLDYATVVIWKF
jgi:putative salt-induced outer membrane protein YdiY